MMRRESEIKPEWRRAPCALFFACAIAVCSAESMSEPRYNGDKLIRPEGYREWVFVGSSLGMGYKEGSGSQKATFHNVYVQPQAYRQFAATGTFPDKTMLIMEKVAPGTNASINKQGQFEDRFIGIEAAVKDETRFPGKWAYFDFVGNGTEPLKESKAFPKDACWNCHNQHGAADNVFVQFYPVLRATREKSGR